MTILGSIGEQVFEFDFESDGLLRHGSRIYVPNLDGLREEILEEAHVAAYAVHPRATKMYHDLRSVYWWQGLKKDVGEYVSRCLVCQQVKVEHQRPSRLLQPLPILEWKWEHTAMDFITGLPRVKGGYDSIWVIIDRLTKSAHFLPIKTKFGTAQYAQIYINEIVRLHGVLVTIVSDRGQQFTSQFWKRLQDELGTRLNFTLPSDLEGVNPVFHVSMLKKYVQDPSRVIQHDTILLEDGLKYQEQPVAIVYDQVKRLRSKDIALVKVIWQNHSVEEATWEPEEEIQAKNPYLF
ncbi:Integrase zinc-binding domain - like 10 [Theobroma cacao]|nr:Integrase zinc-binding domain - like 10 [Theobroma cacao]